MKYLVVIIVLVVSIFTLLSLRGSSAEDRSVANTACEKKAKTELNKAMSLSKVVREDRRPELAKLIDEYAANQFRNSMALCRI